MYSQKLQEITKDPVKALDFASAYEKEGRYEQALEMYEWFYFNALSIRRSLYGIRLGSGLKNWMRLGWSYPKAKQRLIEIRNEEMIRIKNGSWKFENFHAIGAISRELKDKEVPIEIFKLICKKETDKEKINKCFDVVFQNLLDKKELEILQKYFRAPLEYVKEYINDFRVNEEAEKAFILQKGAKEVRKEVLQGLLKVRNNIYFDHIRVLVKALKILKKDKEITKVYKAGKGIISDEEYQEIFE